MLQRSSPGLTAKFSHSNTPTNVFCSALLFVYMTNAFRWQALSSPRRLDLTLVINKLILTHTGHTTGTKALVTQMLSEERGKISAARVYTLSTTPRSSLSA